MICAALVAVSLLQPTADAPADDVARFRHRCEQAKSERIAALESELAQLNKAPRADAARQAKIATTERELSELRSQAAPPTTMPTPPRQGDMGTISPSAGETGATAVRVLEIIDEDDAIVRLKYNVSVAPDDDTDLEPTFTDVWLHGLATDDWSVDAEIEARGVFHVSGNKSFGTTCGGRSVLLLELVEPESLAEPNRDSEQQ